MGARLFFKDVPTQLGTMWIVWGNRAGAVLVERIFLPEENSNRSSDKNADERSDENSFERRIRTMGGFNATDRRQVPEAVLELENILHRCIEGKRTDIDLGIFNFTQCSEFQKTVLFEEYRVPPGWVSTYGRLSVKIGKPGAARTVGRALASNPFPLIIPCHRAVRESGELGGYRGGVHMKRALLEREGVRFNESGRVVMDRVY